MIGWLASAALAGPVLDPGPELDPLARCAAEAEAEGGTLVAPAGVVATSDRVAVVIGVPCHRKDAVPSLAYATRDAVRVGEALESGGFTVFPLLTVVDKAEVQATLDRARAALSPDGTLVVYFSGHGVLRETNGRLSRYLVLSDTDLGSLDRTGLAVRDLDWRVSAIPAAHRVVVQDTCFAATNGHAPGSDVPGGKGIGALESPVKLQTGDLRLYASRFFEQAVESPELRGSLYTAHLLEGLEAPARADLDGDGCVGLLEAHAWAAARTEADRDGFQVPEIAARHAENLILGCTPTAPQRAVVMAPSASGAETRVADGAQIAADGAVEPGRYLVEVSEPVDDGHQVELQPLLHHRFALAAGDWLDLDAELERREGLAAVEVNTAWLRTDLSGPIGLGIDGWASPRDHGGGRPVIGAALRTVPGGSPAPGLLFHEAEAVGTLAWTWTPSWPVGELRLGFGPGLEAGALVRVVSGGKASSGPSVGSIVEPQLRTWFARGPVAGSLAVGLRAVVLDAAHPVDLAPTLRIGFGPRL